jgi:hypothetical protein
MCSKCYKAHAKDSAGPLPEAPKPVAVPVVVAALPTPAPAAAAAAAAAPPPEEAAPAAPAAEAPANRCFGCSKKVGLTGFRCKCNLVFCSTHRHADAHACTFDYKAAAAAHLTKANPTVVASKIHRI